jgi:hypothetical protein
MEIAGITSSWLKLLPFLNRTQKRLYAAERAMELGRGGMQRVHEATGLDYQTIRRGMWGLTTPGAMPDPERIRRQGGGRKKVDSSTSTDFPSGMPVDD